MSIRLLPPVLISRIAAGEVIERPASVVKELVENALDAQATDITITIKGAGVEKIIVRDNGLGMNREDVLLAVERHATSKLLGDDLLHISSLGFRGEALPSIASVSRLILISRTQACDTAWQLQVNAGLKYDATPIASPYGTTVEVSDLFFATPARLKFLKSASTEFGHIVETVEKLALTAPGVGFRLFNDTKCVRDFPPKLTPDEALKHRLGIVIDRQFLVNCLEIKAEQKGIQLTGFIGIPTFHRPSASALYFYVNQRPVRDKFLIGALRAAYQDVLAHDRYPAVALFLNLPPDDVDVNVHPAKAEVRFRDQGLVRALLISSIRQTLSQAGHRASSTVAQATLHAFQQQHSSGRMPLLQSALLTPFPLMTGEYLALQETPKNALENISMETSPSPLENPNAFPLGKAKAQLHNTYILSQTVDGFVIVDQHAAHERLVYEAMKQALHTQSLERETLLIPEVIDLTFSQAQRLIESQNALAHFGLLIESFGEKTILIREVPRLLKTASLHDLLVQLADDLVLQDASSALEEKILARYATFACHNSVRAGRALSLPEMDALLRDMEKTPLSGQCNHGRPTYVELKLSDIERLFGRK